MKRYIEVIFDNSYSMMTMVANKPKHEHAKQIFKDVVLPFLDFNSDDVAFRLLRNGCEGFSKAVKMADSIELTQNVYGVVNYNNNTPLFHTIRDSIDTCQQNSGSYDKMLIFALTDGEDNCNDYMEEVFDELELKKLGIELDVLLVQFAVDSEIQTNNLNGFSQFIGAQTIQVNGNQLVDYKLAKSRLNKALSKSVLNNSYLLPHCFDTSLKGKNYTWNELELQGYLRYWAGMLFREGLIQWDPIAHNSLNETEFREFKFLCALRFKSGFPAELMKRMFLQLSSPYYYCLDEIYWDFADAKWKFFPTIPKVEPVINPDRYKEIDDNPLSMQNNKFSSNIAVELINKISNRNLINAKSRVLNEVIECLFGGTTDITDYTHVFQKIEGILGEGNLNTELHEIVYNLFCDEDFRTTDSSEIDSLCEEIHSIDSAFEEYYESSDRYFNEPVANLFTDLHELNGEQLCEMINLWIKHKEENEQSYFEGLLEEIRKYQEDKNLLIGKLEQLIAPLRNLAEQLLEVDDEEINYWAGNLDEVAHAHVDYPGVQNLSDIQNKYMEEYKEILTLRELYSLEKFFNYIKNRLD